MEDPFFIVARPACIRLALAARRADRMDTTGKKLVLTEGFKHVTANTRHDAHGENRIGAVSHLHANNPVFCLDRSHAERHDIERAPAHTAFKNCLHLSAAFFGRYPVIGWPGLFLRSSADKRPAFSARHVIGGGARQIGIGIMLGIERHHRTARDLFGGNPVPFSLRSVAPIYSVGLAKGGNFFNPETHMRRNVQRIFPRISSTLTINMH